jgi:hypothetical protein
MIHEESREIRAGPREAAGPPTFDGIAFEIHRNDRDRSRCRDRSLDGCRTNRNERCHVQPDDVGCEARQRLRMAADDLGSRTMFVPSV